MNIYIYKSQPNLPNRLQLYKTSFLLGYNSICKVDKCYNNLQMDGQTVNCELETSLHCFISETPRMWVRWLAWVEYCYNTSFHTIAQTTTFRVLYRQDPPHLLRYGHRTTSASQVKHFLEKRDDTLERC